MHWLEKWVIPPRCVITQEATLERDLSESQIGQLFTPVGVCPQCCEPSFGAKVCGACLAQPPAFDRTQVAYYFEAPLTQLVYDLKYHQQHANARLLADLLAEQLDVTEVQALIAIPIHPLRRKQRGFNQAWLIAKRLSKVLNIPLIEKVVERVAHTPSQTQLTAKARAQNLKKAFAVHPAHAQRLHGLQHVALVDDVMTTGATMHEVAKQLKQHSAIKVVEAWAVAKTE
ncbi:ComF family protein [Thiomicrorhabdus aquaedulcis]|uniref:ComF family protein n=1 Tax=Thiomicrorhabdus aquaedulcis TaxID=2211106 RepID=UPI000FD6BA5B|nr:ComF family protein [Thiomicrorhabdus aquaedulcis]